MNTFNSYPKFKDTEESKFPLSIENYKTLRAFIREDESLNDFIKLRNLLIISIQAHSILRISDILSLKVIHVYQSGLIRKLFWRHVSKTKNSKLLNIVDAVQDDLKRVILYYSSLAPNYFNTPFNPLFPARSSYVELFKTKKVEQYDLSTLSNQNLDDFLKNKNHCYQYSSFMKFLKKSFENIGLNPDNYGTTSIRSMLPIVHYFKTGNIKETQHMFGHESEKTTIRYINKVAQIRAANLLDQMQVRDEPFST